MSEDPDPYECDQCSETFDTVSEIKQHQQEELGHNLTYGRGKLAEDFKRDLESGKDFTEETSSEDGAEEQSESNRWQKKTEDDAEQDSSGFDFSTESKDEAMFSESQNNSQSFSKSEEDVDESENSLEDSSMSQGDVTIELNEDFFKAPNDALNRMVRLFAAKKYGKKPRELTDEELEQAASYTKVIFDEAVPDEHKKATGMMGAMMGIASIHASALDDMEKIEGIEDGAKVTEETDESEDSSDSEQGAQPADSGDKIRGSVT